MTREQAVKDFEMIRRGEMGTQVVRMVSDGNFYVLKVWSDANALNCEVKQTMEWGIKCNRTAFKMRNVGAVELASALDEFLKPIRKIPLYDVDKEDDCYVCLSGCDTVTKCKHYLCRECADKCKVCKVLTCGVCRGPIL